MKSPPLLSIPKVSVNSLRLLIAVYLGPMMRALLVALALFSVTNVVKAGSITFGGKILQSTSDGTGPAVNNLALNSIQDGDDYTVTLVFSGSISGPGAFNPLTGATLQFFDSTASVSENSFDVVSLTISANGSFLDFSLLGCLTTGSGCSFGNQLAANFRITATMLNSQNVVAQSIPALTPLDLLEDDGVTDIQGTVTTYSYAGAVNNVPEPSSTILLGIVLAGLMAANRRLGRNQ